MISVAGMVAVARAGSIAGRSTRLKRAEEAVDKFGAELLLRAGGRGGGEALIAPVRA